MNGPRMTLRRRLRRVGLTTRLMTASAAALLIGGAALLGGIAAHEIRDTRAGLRESAEAQLDEIAPLIADVAVVGDYSVIQQMLDARAGSSHVESLSWTDRRGAVVRASLKTTERAAPDWFARTADLAGPTVEREIVIGGKRYGRVQIRVDATTRVNELWDELVTGACILGASVAANLLLLMLTLRAGLEPLRRLSDATHRLARDIDAEVRIAPSGPPEMRLAIAVFNRSAATIRRLHESLRTKQLQLKDSHDELEARVVERTAQLAHTNAELEKANDGLKVEIEQRNALMAELRESEARFRALTTMSTDWFWEQDTHFRFVQVASGSEDLGGITRDEPLGKALWELEHTERVDGDWDSHRSVLAAHMPYRDLLLRRQLPGGDRYLLISGAPCHDAHGGFTGYRGIARDVTAQKRTEAELIQARDHAQAGSRAKSAFLASMSHEIRTPMNGLLGMAGLLLNTELDARQAHFARTMHRSATALLKVISDILDFSKIEAGRMELDDVEFEPRTLLDEAVKAYATAAVAKRLEIASHARARVPHLLRGDPTRIGQVLSNLIGNAIKYTDKGSVIASVEVIALTEGHAMLRFVVRDTGVGVAEADRESIFEPFMQTDGRQTRKFGGTGLGLAISRQLVRMMGGEVDVVSRVGRGSRFAFTVKLKTCPPRATLPPKRPIAGRRVLIVDDSRANREILRHQLIGGGMVVEAASSAEHALALLDRTGPLPEIAVLDVNMPETDGLELAQQIRATPRLQDMRIVMLSSAGHDLPRARLRELDVGGCLTKPVGHSQLLDLLGRVMADAPADVPASATAESASSEQRFRGRVLVVEDNDVNRLVAASMLETWGLKVDVVTDGRQAVEAARGTHYDLVLMDCQMPVMDGYAATAAIREQENPAMRTTIVALTMNAKDGDREKCLKSGMDDYVAKPFEREALGRVLQRWLPPAPIVEAMTLAGVLG